MPRIPIGAPLPKRGQVDTQRSTPHLYTTGRVTTPGGFTGGRPARPSATNSWLGAVPPLYSQSPTYWMEVISPAEGPHGGLIHEQGLTYVSMARHYRAPQSQSPVFSTAITDNHLATASECHCTSGTASFHLNIVHLFI